MTIPANRRCAHRRPQSDRAGVSLVEMLAASAGNMAIVGLTLVILVAVGRADRTLRDRGNDRVALQRLAIQLRDDIHAAAELAWDDDKRTLTLTTPDGSVVAYTGEKNRWVRRLVAPDADDNQGELSGAFRAPRSLRLKVDPATAEAGDVVTLVYSAAMRDRPEQTTPVAELTVTVGRDRRLLHP